MQRSLEETYGESICLECCIVWKRNVDSTKRRYSTTRAFEIWIGRRMMKVPWTEHKTKKMKRYCRWLRQKEKQWTPLEVDRRDGKVTS